MRTTAHDGLSVHRVEEIIKRLERIERALATSQAAYLDSRKAAELTCIADHMIECWRRDGEGPAYVKP